MGHLVRSFRLAQALAGDFSVVFLNGGPLPSGIEPPRGIRIIDLPPLGMGSDGLLISRDPQYTVEQAKQLRRQRVHAVYEQHQPRIIVIELFPFGRMKFADELLPLLEHAREGRNTKPLILCSLRDILVSGRIFQQRHDDRACTIINEYFDAVLVHTDPAFARLEDSFKPSQPLTVPVHYTGFVLPEHRAQDPQQRTRRVVVSAGGGIVGAPLLGAAVAAHAMLWETERLPMTVIAGPFLPEADWDALRVEADHRQGLTLLRSVPDLVTELRGATASVSQCGYNTTMDILCSGVAALVVPFATPSENEQAVRARALERLGLVRVLDPARLDGPTLAAEILRLLEFQPEVCGLNLAGAEHSARLVKEWAGRKRIGNTVPRSVEVVDE
jgi:predicted glycosyltransferase